MLMPDDKPVPDSDPPVIISEDAIQSLVTLVQTAEILASEMACPVHRAVEMLLRSGRAMQQTARGHQSASLAAMVSAVTRPQ
jgi:hypothetical protein